MEPAIDAFVLEDAPALYDKIAVVDVNFDVLRFYPWQVGLEDKGIGVFIQVNRWIPAANFSAESPRAVNDLLEKPLDLLRQVHRERN